MKQINILFVLILIALFFSACRGGKHAPMTDPDSPANASDAKGINSQNLGSANSGPTYIKDIKPIFEKNCTPCHAQGSAYGSWLDYKSTFTKRALIRLRVVENKDMPVGKSLPDSTRAIIAEWIDNGAIESFKETPSNQSEAEQIRPEEQSIETKPPILESPLTPETPLIPGDPLTPGAPQSPIQIDESKITYTENIRPLFEKYCSLCHNENSGPSLPNWLQYDIVVLKKDALFDRMFIKKDMPLQGMPTPTEEENELIHQWILKGVKYEN